MANLLDELNATTLKVIWPQKVTDLAFKKKSPFLAYLRAHAVPHGGGAFLQQVFLYGQTIGGAYSKGQTFDTTKQQLMDVTEFDIKYYEQSDTEYLEEVRVEAKGSANVIDLVNARTEAMMMTMNENVAIEMYQHGQPSATNIASNRVESVNGLAEVANNGTDPSWQGDIFTTYGQNTRGSTIGTALNSTPYFVGNADGSAGPITYPVLIEQAMDCRFNGGYNPDILLTNKAGYMYCLERIQPQQRFGQEKEYIWGADSFYILGMRLMIDDYAPSLKFGVNNAKTGNYLTSTFSSPSVPTSNSNLPASQTITVGETFWEIYSYAFALKLANDPLFQFGWTGYKEAQNSTIVTGQALAGLNIIATIPGGVKQIYGVNS